MIRSILLAPLLLALMVTAAAAHKLKVFATVDGDAVTGYAFFVGGGRAKGAPWMARTATGAEIAKGATDGEGRYRVVPPKPVTSDIVITVDAQEGHVASAVIAATRLGGGGGVASPAAAEAPAPPPDAPVAISAEAAALIESAVQRQIEPLLVRIEEMDSRLRLTDALSGIFLIVGAAGMLLWYRRRAR